MRTTIKDVARACGVSNAAVSMVLSGRPGRISEATREKIRQTAIEMDYHPNQMAANLGKRRSRLLGVVLNDIRNAHIAELYMAICGTLEEKGYIPVSHILSDASAENGMDLARRLVGENLCGLVWGKPYEPGRTKENEQIHKLLDSLDIPIFTMGHDAFASRGMNVCYDYEKAGYLATMHLVEAGHRRIGCICGPDAFEVSSQRLAGYRRALQEAGIAWDEKLVFGGDYTMASGSEALPYLMGQKVTALFAQNDEMAFGVYKSARMYGIRIPEDLSVIGCDNVDFDDVLEVPLSTVEVPAREMGRFIGEQLIFEIENPPDEKGAQGRKTVYYEPNLYLRGSVRKL